MLCKKMGIMYITNNINAPVYQKKCQLIHASPEIVWNVLTDINHWKYWFGVKHSVLNGPLKPDTSFDWKKGLANIHSVIHIAEPYSNFGWSGKVLGTFAVHNWSIKQLDDYSVVTVSESMEGFIPSVFRRSLNHILERELTNSIDLLRKECEKDNYFKSIEQLYAERQKMEPAYH